MSEESSCFCCCYRGSLLLGDAKGVVLEFGGTGRGSCSKFNLRAAVAPGDNCTKGGREQGEMQAVSVGGRTR